MRMKRYELAALLLSVFLLGGCTTDCVTESIQQMEGIVGKEALTEAKEYTHKTIQEIKEIETEEDLNTCIDKMSASAKAVQQEVKAVYDTYIAEHPEVQEEIQDFFIDVESMIKGE